jgi:hypothetical protein
MFSAESIDFDSLLDQAIYYSVDPLELTPDNTLSLPQAFPAEEPPAIEQAPQIEQYAENKKKKKPAKAMKRDRSDDTILQDAIADIKRILHNLQSGDVSVLSYSLSSLHAPWKPFIC